MDTRQYQELLEDVRIDLAEGQRSIAEMRSLETYVQRKLDAKGGNDAQYSELLSDVRRDIGGVDRELSELRGVESYLQRKLKGDRSGGESFAARPREASPPVVNQSPAARPLPRTAPVSLPPEPPAAPQPAPAEDPVVVEFEPVDPSKSKPASKPGLKPLTKPAAVRDKPMPKPAETRPRPRPSPAEEIDANVTVEFGPDGFPMTEPR